MIKFLLILCAILIFVCAVFFFLWRLGAAKGKAQKETIERLSKKVEEVNKENSRLEHTIDIIKNNRKDADEKIDSLHNGDAVDNALNELRNDKN